MIKVLIVEDSKVVSEYLYYILNKDPKIEVIGNVNNGKKAIAFLKHHKPDVITMDIIMPVMDGLEATRRIMETNPIPIIIVTASKSHVEVETSMEALAAGALSIIDKPHGIGHPKEYERVNKLTTMVKLMAEVKVVTRKIRHEKRPGIIPLTDKRLPSVLIAAQKKIIGIGISSGGPPILKKIFSKITEDFPIPIVVVQHITGGFLDGLVQWLSRQIPIPVRIATQNEALKPGRVYFAPDNYQMGIISRGLINLSKCSGQSKICPSVAHLFKSITTEYGKKSIGIILSGMGSDGARELKLLRDTGAITIAQDKESSLVHGMPGVAIKLNAAGYILNSHEISDFLYKIERDAHYNNTIFENNLSIKRDNNYLLPG